MYGVRCFYGACAAYGAFTVYVRFFTVLYGASTVLYGSLRCIAVSVRCFIRMPDRTSYGLGTVLEPYATYGVPPFETHRHTGTQTGIVGYRKRSPSVLCTRICPCPFFEVTPPAEHITAFSGSMRAYASVAAATAAAAPTPTTIQSPSATPPLTVALAARAPRPVAPSSAAQLNGKPAHKVLAAAKAGPWARR